MRDSWQRRILDFPRNPVELPTQFVEHTLSLASGLVPIEPYTPEETITRAGPKGFKARRGFEDIEKG